MVKKVIICFNSEEANEVRAFQRRLLWTHQEKGFAPDSLDVEVIYPCDTSQD
ncbi:MAG: hypothetical protein JJT82_03380 [Legionellaceae bacterium]|nr:hypothetical protein [Legionellaceae bacterium]